MKDRGSEDLACRVERLTPGQREVLALVTDHATSKEIARVLGISPHTVDARMRAALQTLGVASRREAAVIFRTARDGGAMVNAYQSSAYQPSHLAAAAAADDVFGQDERRADEGDAADRMTGERREPEAAREVEPAMGADAAMWAPVSFAPRPQFRLWGGVNDLTRTQRLVAAFVVMVIAMLGFGMLLSGMQSLSELGS